MEQIASHPNGKLSQQGLWQVPHKWSWRPKFRKHKLGTGRGALQTPAFE